MVVSPLEKRMPAGSVEDSVQHARPETDFIIPNGSVSEAQKAVVLLSKMSVYLISAYLSTNCGGLQRVSN